MKSFGNYSDKDVKEDIKLFFQDNNHWVYQYGGLSSCDINSPYHRKQIEVLFEDRYWHWVTDRAVNTLLKEGFLKEEIRMIDNVPIRFVYRYNIRRIKREINKRVKLIKRYSNPIITKAVGNYAEIIFKFMFRAHNFEIAARNTNEYCGKKWEQTSHDLDFIIRKDDIAYGIEIKNTLSYMERDEFDIKLKICKELDLVPLFILRSAPGNQFDEINKAGGFILRFKTQIYPPGQEELVKDIWDLMRLPVNVWKDIPPKIEEIFLREYRKRTI